MNDKGATGLRPCAFLSPSSDLAGVVAICVKVALIAWVKIASEVNLWQAK
jgi:hypothetical protein